MSRIRMIERLNLILSMILFYVSICESVPLDLKFLNQLHQRSLDGTLGLNPFNLNQHGTFIGFLPGLGEAVAPNVPSDINAKLPAPMAIMGDYIQLDTSDLNLKGIDHHVEYIKNLDGKPVWEIALMPGEGLQSVTLEVANRIATKMKWLNDQGIVVWLRFAHEMNGDWYKWGLQPQLFLEKWKLVAYAVKSQTINTYMLWAPNSRFGGVGDTRGGYSQYWPGVKYVDILGISFYHYGGFDRNNVLPASQEAVKMIKEFSDLYAIPNDLPLVLSETGASFTRSLQTGQPAPGGASEYDMKLQWLKQLLSSDITNAAPRFKAFLWFEVKKDENAAGGSPVKSEDFRLLLSDNRLSHDAVSFISS